MDSKLDEIRQRVEAAKAQKEKGDSITAACISWSIVANDIPYLLSEVDRLNKNQSKMQYLFRKQNKKIALLTVRAEKAEAERDAAVLDLQKYITKATCECDSCANRKGGHITCGNPNAGYNVMFHCWQWCGQEAGKGETK